MVEITLFELHLDDATVTANAPFSAVESMAGLDEEAGRRFLPGGGDEDDDGVGPAGDTGGPGPLAAVAVLVVVAVAVVALRRLVGGEPEPVPE